MKVAVAFQTCERYDYTEETVQSFIRLNGQRDYELYYGDDASTDPEIHALMKRNGVAPAIVNRERKGCGTTCRLMLKEVARLSGADYLMLVQNDCRSEVRLPIELVQRVFEMNDVGIFRLFGHWKDGPVQKRKTWDCHLGKEGKPKVRWSPFKIWKTSLEVGCIHWMYLPSIIKTEFALSWQTNAFTEREMYQRQIKLNPEVLTVRPRKRNFLSHMGPREARTPGFIS